MADVDLDIERVVAGGDGLARAADGQVVFVAGALPGERVRARLVEAKRGFARAELAEVVEPAAARAQPPCPHVAEGCGGCDWQHVDPEAQRQLKAEIVADALRHVGKLEPPEIGLGPRLPADGYRTTVRAAIRGGRAALRHRHSHDLVTIDGCLVAHPMLVELIDDGRFGAAREVTLRAGVASGERLARFDGHVDPAVDAGVELPADVFVVHARGRSGGRGAIHEDVDGHRFRVSATSFFQARPDGAQALVDLVRRAAGDVPRSTFVDLFSGVGVFAATVGNDAAEVIAVEGSAAACRDARHNVPGARVLELDVNRWTPVPADIVVADPSRTGLGANVVSRIAATAADTVVLVSCDAAALGRDAQLLTQHGYQLVTATLVDLFPHTSHVEVVTSYARRAGGTG